MSSEVRRTTCNRDCPDACGILATVADGRVTALRGDPDHPVTRGFLCYRTSRFLELQDAPARLREPLLREHGQLRPVSWDRALALVAERLLAIRAESGPSALFHYRSGGSLGILKAATDLFFDRFGPCTGKVGDICSGAGEAAQVLDFGVSDSNDLFDLRSSRHILLWGKNPAVSNVHLVPLLKECRERGAQVVLIDPVAHKSTQMVDRWLRPRPAGDLALALGTGRLLFERGLTDARALAACESVEGFRALCMQRTVAGWAEAADLPAEELEFLAACLHEGPAAILVGWGMQRRRLGGAIVRALDALSAISGNLFRPGGGCSFYFKRRAAFTTLNPEVRHPRVIREPLLGPDLLAADPPVRLMWVTAGNPVAMLPDSATVARALEQIEFLVVADCFLTDTAARAHLVLPVPTLLEDDDVLGAYGHHWLSESRPVVAPPPGVRHELDIFRELADRTGLQDYPRWSVEEWKQEALRPAAAKGASLEELRRQGAVRSPLASGVLFGDYRVRTQSGKVNLIDALPTGPALEVPPPTPGSSGPLWLFSNSTEKSQASVWSGRGLGERTWVLAHPDAVPDLVQGQIVVVESALGSVEAELRLDARQRADVCVMPKGGHFDRGQSANALIPARATDLGLGAAYLDVLVRIRPLVAQKPAK
jgi:anaerobic selenocysteine-containing dehydrogenase